MFAIIISILATISLFISLFAVYRIKMFKQIDTEMAEVGIDVNNVHFSIYDLSEFK